LKHSVHEIIVWFVDVQEMCHVDGMGAPLAPK